MFKPIRDMIVYRFGGLLFLALIGALSCAVGKRTDSNCAAVHSRALSCAIDWQCTLPCAVVRFQALSGAVRCSQALCDSARETGALSGAETQI